MPLSSFTITCALLLYFGGVITRYRIASSITANTDTTNQSHLFRQALMKLPMVNDLSMILELCFCYLKMSTAMVASTDMADSQNEALVISLALAVA